MSMCVLFSQIIKNINALAFTDVKMSGIYSRKILWLKRLNVKPGASQPLHPHPAGKEISWHPYSLPPTKVVHISLMLLICICPLVFIC